MFSSDCCFMNCMQVSQEAGQVVWSSRLFKIFPQFVVICTVKDFGIVNEADIDVFLELLCFLYDPTNVGNLISVSSSFLNPAWTSGSSQFMYFWNVAWGFWAEYYACEMSTTVHFNILWHYPFWGQGWKLTFSSLVATAELSKFADILSATL